ncbi:MAG TPA: hypothetical protein DHW61_12805 [Lachnoclostridium phytofermentans]|uniref:Uncharacterized protein n=1 Tax=Lachnoclostridium phytofermentans TaxID=66219 RepID=A0A3D2X8M1_9FIRM|nr:hypothetical protein [Lachnoclostridium sp.]HCL03264.1 hypothetical protein [Lachnoclostridium phytofermentans]
MNDILPIQEENYILIAYHKEFPIFYQEIIDSIKESNPQVLILVYMIDMHQAFREITGNDIQSFYQEDGLHPNKEGANIR